MRSTIILAIFALVFTSCHSDLPELPDPKEVEGYVYCGYNNDGSDAVTKPKADFCKSPYVLSKEDCEKIPGRRYYSDKDCTVPK